MSHFLDRLNYFSQPRESFAGGHGVVTGEDRTWEDAYRNRWAHDKIVRSTHGVNCTGLVLVEDLRQGRHRHLGNPADRLPAHALGHAQPRAARLLARRELQLVPVQRQPREVPAGARPAAQELARGAPDAGPGRGLGFDRRGRRQAARLPAGARPRRLRALELGRGQRDRRRRQRLHHQEARPGPRDRLFADPRHVDGELRRGLALSQPDRRRVHELLRLVLRPAARPARRSGASRPTCPSRPTGTTRVSSSPGAPTCRRRARPTRTSSPRCATRARRRWR